jgi:hypothetical protein
MKSRSPRLECRFKFRGIDRLENPTFARGEHGAPKPGHLNAVAPAEISFLWACTVNKQTGKPEPPAHTGQCTIAGACNQTAPPSHTPPPGEDGQVQQKQKSGDGQPVPPPVDNEKVGNTTVGDLAKVLTNEIGSLSTPNGGDPKELENGDAALANALINNAKKARPNEVAPDTGTASPQLGKAMRDAFTNRAKGGVDPVHGRTFYGTSHIPPSRLHSRPIGNGRQTVYEHFGPFNDSWSGRTTWIYIYNDPGH